MALFSILHPYILQRRLGVYYIPELTHGVLRSLYKNPKVTKFDPNELSQMFFDSVIEESVIDSAIDHSLGQLASAAMTTAIDLTKIVIENKVRNTEIINDEDIYKIYKKSFETIIKSASIGED